MKTLIIPVAALLMVALAPLVFSEPNAKVRPSMDQKIVGVWEGRSGCAGNFVFRADGTYELTGYGPAPIDSSGTWKVQGDSLPAVLILKCKKSDLEEEEGKSSMLTLIRLDDEGLIVRRANQTDADRYGRAKK